MKKVFGWGVVILLCVAWIKFSLLSQAGDCGEKEQAVQAVIATSQQCSSDSDCSFLRLSCPFDCITPMRKGTRKEIIAAIGIYHDSCMPMCRDCPKETPRAVKCVEQMCRAS